MRHVIAMAWLGAVVLLASACGGGSAAAGQSAVQEYADGDSVLELVLSQDVLGSEPYACVEIRGSFGERRKIDLGALLRKSVDATDWWVEVEHSAFEEPSRDHPQAYQISRRSVTTFVSAPQESSAPKEPTEAPTVLLGNYFHDFAALTSDGTVFVGVDSRPTADGDTADVMKTVLAPGAGDSLAVVQFCGEQLKLALSNALARFGLPADLEYTNNALAALIGFPGAQGRVDPSLTDGTFLKALDAMAAIDAAAEPTMPDWNELSPDDRALYDAPSDVRNRLKAFTLILDLPPSWVGAGESLCTKTADGWNGCIGLDVVSADMIASGAPVLLDGLRLPGTDVHVLLLGGAASPSGAQQVIAEIAASELELSDTIDLKLESEAPPSDVLAGGGRAMTDAVTAEITPWE